MYSDSQCSRLNRLSKKTRESRSCSRIEGAASFSKNTANPTVDHRNLARSSSAGVLPNRSNGRAPPMAKLHDLAILPAAAPEADGGQGSPTQLMLLPSLPLVPHAPAGGPSTSTEIVKQN